MSAKQPTPPPNGSHWNEPTKSLRPTPPPLPPRQENTISAVMAQLIMQHTKQIEAMNSRMLLSQTTAEIHIGVLRQRIEAAKQRLESLNGEHVGQAELHAVMQILEGK